MKYFLYIGILGFILIGCKDIIEDDISEERIETYSPRDGDTLNVQTITFWWKEMEGAIDYRFELTDEQGLFITESVQTNTRVTFTADSLSKGETYIWRVRAENGSYESPYTQSTFYMSDQINISSSSVTLVNPDDLDSLSLSSNSAKFEWSAVTGAEEYEFVIGTERGFSNSDNYVSVFTPEVSILRDAINTTGIEDFSTTSQFYWRVRARNEVFVTDWSSTRTVRFKE